jgi:plastocyanin
MLRHRATRPAAAALAAVVVPLPLHPTPGARNPHPARKAATVHRSAAVWRHRAKLDLRASRHRPHRIVVPLAHAAGDPSDTISDFQFSPATITVHVGDTITWSNAGPTDHTATARDGSFDTGVLKKGTSGSHTFTATGTFAYYCTIHPFMHGTVVVLASTASATPSQGSGSSGSSGSGASAGTSAGQASSSSSTNTLPNTGFDTGAALACGVVLLGAGLALRRARAN